MCLHQGKGKCILENKKNLSIKCTCTSLKKKNRQLNVHALKSIWSKSYRCILCVTNFKCQKYHYQKMSPQCPQPLSNGVKFLNNPLHNCVRPHFMIVFDSIQLESTLHVWNDAAYKYTHGEKHASFQSLGAVRWLYPA